MNVTLAENLFLSNLNFIELDSLSVPSAKDRFHEFQRAGVIKDNCTFDDSNGIQPMNTQILVCILISTGSHTESMNLSFIFHLRILQTMQRHTVYPSLARMSL